MKKYSIVRIGSEYVVQAGETSILKVSSRREAAKLVELLTHHTRVDAQRFYERLGFARSHVGMTLRF